VSWKSVALGDVCKVIAGQSPESINYNKEGKGLAFYQGKKDFGDVYVNPPTVWTTEVTKEANKNDILMSVRAPVGPVNIATENICIGRGLAAIRATERINQAYLFYYLLKIEKELVGNAGAVFNSINKTQIENLLVPLPPIATQQKIVAKLDAIFAQIDTTIAAAESNVKNAEALFQSYLTEVFERGGEEWETKKLPELCTLFNGRAYKKEELLDIGKYTVLRVGNFFTNEHWYYSDLELEENKYCDNGDLLYAWSASFGPRIWEGNKVIYHYHIWKVIPNIEVIDKNFLYFLLEWDVEKIKKDHGTGTTMIHVSKSNMETRILPYINLVRQKEIVKRLKNLKINIDLLILSYKDKKIQTELLKQSILQQAFSGELVKD
jgi:type I restriction enzyme S subunit